MVQLTEKAAEVLLEALKNAPTKPEQALRLVSDEKGFQLNVDEPSEADQVITHKDEPVLIVDQDTDDVLRNAVIDVDEGPEGARLVVRKMPSS